MLRLFATACASLLSGIPHALARAPDHVDPGRPDQRQPVTPPPRTAVAPLANGIRCFKDLKYAQIGSRRLFLDLYLPTSESPGNAAEPAKMYAPGPKSPVIVWIPSSGWGETAREARPALELVKHGYAVAVIAYRPADVSPFPGQIHDCKAAVRWLRARGVEYGVDPERIGVWGASSGGHLAALLGTSRDDLVLEGWVGDHLEQPSDVQAVCDWFGPVDLSALLVPEEAWVNAVADAGRRPSASPVRRALATRAALAAAARALVGADDDTDRLVALANPLTFVSSDDPPVLIMHGDQDRVVPLSQSMSLHEALVSAGVESTLRVVAGAGHGLTGDGLIDEVAEFFGRHLRAAR